MYDRRLEALTVPINKGTIINLGLEGYHFDKNGNVLWLSYRVHNFKGWYHLNLRVQGRKTIATVYDFGNNIKATAKATCHRDDKFDIGVAIPILLQRMLSV